MRQRAIETGGYQNECALSCGGWCCAVQCCITCCYDAWWYLTRFSDIIHTKGSLLGRHLTLKLLQTRGALMRVIVQACGDPESQNPKGDTHKQNQISKIRSNVTNDALDHVSANRQKLNILPIRHCDKFLSWHLHNCGDLEIASLQFCHSNILCLYSPLFVRIGISLLSQPSDFQSIPSDHYDWEAMMKGWRGATCHSL